MFVGAEAGSERQKESLNVSLYGKGVSITIPAIRDLWLSMAPLLSPVVPLVGRIRASASTALPFPCTGGTADGVWMSAVSLKIMLEALMQSTGNDWPKDMTMTIHK